VWSICWAPETSTSSTLAMVREKSGCGTSAVLVAGRCWTSIQRSGHRTVLTTYQHDGLLLLQQQLAHAGCLQAAAALPAKQPASGRSTQQLLHDVHHEGDHAGGTPATQQVAHEGAVTGIHATLDGLHLLDSWL